MRVSSVLRVLVLVLVLTALALPAAAQCSATVALSLGAPDVRGVVTGTLNYSLSYQPWYNEAYVLFINDAQATTFYRMEQSGTIPLTLDLWCKTSPVKIRVEGPCGAKDEKSIVIDSRTTGSISGSLDADGNLPLTMTYDFHHMPAGYSATLWIDPPAGVQDIVWTWYHLSQSGTISTNINLSCRPPGDYKFTLSLGEWYHQELRSPDHP